MWEEQESTICRAKRFNSDSFHSSGVKGEQFLGYDYAADYSEHCRLIEDSWYTRSLISIKLTITTRIKCW